MVVAGGAAASGALLYYLLRSDYAEAEPKESKRERGKVNVDDLTKNDVLEILTEVTKSQDALKSVIKDLTQELIKNQLTLEQTYAKIKVSQPEDPLESYGISMNDFDVLLEKHQNDPTVIDAINRIMGSPSNMLLNQKVQGVNRKTIVQIHEFMLIELKKLVEDIQKNPDRLSLDARTLTMAAQVFIGARVETKFGLTSDEIESAVLYNHTGLANDPEFARLNVQMQATMSQLMGSQFPCGVY